MPRASGGGRVDDMRLSRLISRLVPEPIKRPFRPMLGWRRWSAHPPVVKIGSFAGIDVAYRDHTTDVDVLRESFDSDIFFAGVPEYVPAEHHVIMDVGAHIGTFSLLASTKVSRGKVFAVEACLESYNLCRINIALNQAGNIDVSNLALADQCGECMLQYDVGNWGHSTVAPLTGRGEMVPAETLRGFMQAKQIERCDFLKMNCEGAEFPILLSTPRDVLRRFGMMLVLYHCDLYKAATETTLLSHLQESGFDTTVRQRTAERGWIIATRRAA